VANRGDSDSRLTDFLDMAKLIEVEVTVDSRDVKRSKMPEVWLNEVEY
jgi:hypothetical protein